MLLTFPPTIINHYKQPSAIISHNERPRLLHQLPSPRFFPTHDMADHRAPTLFRARFESALQAYQYMTGVTLAEHPLTVRFQNPHSAESIASILKSEARVPSDLQASNRIVNSIENTVSMLFSISTSTSFRDAIVLVRKEALMTCLHTHDGFSQPYPPAKVIVTGLAIFFSVCAVSSYIWYFFLTSQ